MKILHHTIYLIFFSLLLTISIQADLKALETPTQNEQIKKEVNYKHLKELQNGKSLTNAKNTINVKKPSGKVKKPKIWHPKVKGVDLGPDK
jgi:hypothetical protein